MLKLLFCDEKSIQKDSYIFNTLSGLLNAFQSVFVLMVINRTIGLENAGVFTIAYAVANLMLNIGKYGIRNYQVSDVNKKYTFDDYYSARIVTSVAMIIVSIAYVTYTSKTLGYASDKTIIILMMCILKVVDSIEDVFYGHYQLLGRLDVASKCFTFRLLLTIIAYIAGIIILRNLLIATLISTIVAVLSSVYFITVTYKVMNSERIRFVLDNVKQLLMITFSLFGASFLSFYMINAPKYSIDAFMSSTDQANYGFISMPVFVVGLLTTFVYMPVLKKLAELYSNHQISEFMVECKKQFLYVFGISIVVLIGSYLLGIPVLSILYSTDLTLFKTELMILMLSGCILAYTGLLMTLLTIMRKQKMILVSYMISSLIEVLFSNWFVNNYGILGASYILLFAIIILLLCLVLIFHNTLRS